MTELTTNVRAPRAAYGACGWAILFALIHLYWGFGGPIGLPAGLVIFDHKALFVVNLVAIPLCLMAAALALSLIKPWGERIPRWLRLYAAWAATIFFCAHALPSIAEGLTLFLATDSPVLSERDRLSLFVYEPYWLAGGVLFGAAAVRFKRNFDCPADKRNP